MKSWPNGQVFEVSETKSSLIQDDGLEPSRGVLVEYCDRLAKDNTGNEDQPMGRNGRGEAILTPKSIPSDTALQVELNMRSSGSKKERIISSKI
jgi:hypothetical protein